MICAIQNGYLKCWGNYSTKNFYGTAIPNPIPTDVTFTKLSLTNSHVCAITTAGAVRCFGNDQGYKCVTTGLDSGVTLVSVSNQFSCVVQNGQLKCWGSNYSPTTILDAANALPPGGITAISQVGDTSMCVIQNGALKCWANSNVAVPTPSVVPGFESGVTYTQGLCAIKGGEYKLPPQPADGAVRT